MTIDKAQVVIQTAFLGDLILSIPFLKRVKNLHPDEKLVLICKKGLGSFLKELKLIDDYFEIAKSDRQSYLLALKFLESFSISNLFCVHRSIRSQLFAAQITARKKIGFKSFLSFLIFNDHFSYELSWPDAVRKFKLLANLDSEVKSALAGRDFGGLNSVNLEGAMPAVPEIFSFQPRKTDRRFLKVCLFPGSVWATKRWTLEGFTEVAAKFIQLGYEVLLLGGPDEKDLCDQIALVVPKAQVLAAKLSVAQSIQQISESDLVVANDSAATHMAAFAGTPAVTIFGPTTLDLGFRPWTNEARVVQTDLECRPCGKHGHQICPLGHHNCMRFIDSETVTQKALSLINSR